MLPTAAKSVAIRAKNDTAYGTIWAVYFTKVSTDKVVKFLYLERNLKMVIFSTKIIDFYLDRLTDDDEHNFLKMERYHNVWQGPV